MTNTRLTIFRPSRVLNWIKVLKRPIKAIKFRRQCHVHKLEKQLRVTRHQREENRKRLISAQLELISYKQKMQGAIPVVDENGNCLWDEALNELLRSPGIDCGEIAQQAVRIGRKYSGNNLARLLLASIAQKLDPNPHRQKELGFAMVDAGLFEPAYRNLSPLAKVLEFSEDEQRRFRIALKNLRSIDDQLKVDLPYAIEQWSDKLETPEKVQFILYADINMNVVDGSSVWLSSMASILSDIGDCILITKKNITSDVVWSNIQKLDGLFTVQPSDLGTKCTDIDASLANQVISLLDHDLPGVRRVFIRGLEVATLLHQTMQFSGRTCVYLTDFYDIQDGRTNISTDARKKLRIVTEQAHLVLCQTSLIAETLENILDLPVQTFLLPPPVHVKNHGTIDQNIPRRSIKIGYAGKITPDWGVLELLDWVASLRGRGFEIELHILPGKFSDRGIQGLQPGFSASIQKRVHKEAVVYETMNRADAVELMATMDFVWCFRPARLEDRTLELSTKLVEMLAVGARCITYPSEINKRTLGTDYPFFIRSCRDLENCISARGQTPQALTNQLRINHSIENIRDRLGAALGIEQEVAGRRLCVSGHDLKFIYPFVSSLKASGHLVMVDRWEWGKPEDVRRSERLHSWADVTFCEWGLANAVWHSRNKQVGKRLLVRLHAQEVREKARKFGNQISIQEVDKAIFVNRSVRARALELWKWPAEKTIIVPNYVQESRYRFRKDVEGGAISLGMVGMVPQLKRPDRAIDLLVEACHRGFDARLRIKGHRPEDLPFMHGPGRRHELDYYFKLYQKIDDDALTRERVSFDPWGSDMSHWYTKINVIISCSDEESFHYALADGVLAGCFPLVWPWAKGQDLYPDEWIVEGTHQALDKLLEFQNMSTDEKEKTLTRNRSYVVERFGQAKIFRDLYELVYDLCGVPDEAASNATTSGVTPRDWGSRSVIIQN